MAMSVGVALPSTTTSLSFLRYRSRSPIQNKIRFPRQIVSKLNSAEVQVQTW